MIDSRWEKVDGDSLERVELYCILQIAHVFDIQSSDDWDTVQLQVRMMKDQDMTVLCIHHNHRSEGHGILLDQHFVVHDMHQLIQVVRHDVPQYQRSMVHDRRQQGHVA